MQHPRSNATRYRMRKSSGLAGPQAELNSRVRLQATLPYIYLQWVSEEQHLQLYPPSLAMPPPLVPLDVFL